MKKNIKAITCSVLSIMLTQMNILAAEQEAPQDETTKDETVYAMLNADGSVADEIISSWIHNEAGIHDIKETLELKNVENVKSEEEPAIDGDQYTWNIEGTDVYYKGTSDQQLPIEITIQYFLDGRRMTPDEMAGKSGKLEIHISMKNTKSSKKIIQGVETTIHPLYLAAGVIDLNRDHFFNVTCDQAKIVSDGNNQVVGFFTLPGFEDTLQSAGIRQTEDLPIHDTYIIKSDVEEFELGPVMIAMTPEVPLDQLKEIHSLDDLTNGIDALNGAGDQLLHGTHQLHDATDVFASKMQELNFSVAPLGSGILTLNTGAKQLYQGSTQLSSGLQTLKEGLDQVRSGSDALQNGTSQLSALNQGSIQLNTGAKQLQQGLNKTLNDGKNLWKAAEKNGELQQLSHKLANAATVIDTLLIQANDIMSGFDELSDALLKGNPAQHIPSLKDSTQQTVQYANQTAQDINSICTLAKQGDTDVLNALQTIEAKGNVSLCGTDPKVHTTAKAAAAQQYATASSQIVNGILQKLTAMNTQITSLQESMETIASMAKELGTASTSIAALQTGIHDLEQGIQQLKTGSDSLVNGSTTLEAGTEKLSDLKDGVDALHTAMDTIVNNMPQLTQGSSSLEYGLLDVKNGTQNLAENTPVLLNGVQQLRDASSTLADKTGELNDGMNTFKTTGLDTMTSKVAMTMDDISRILAIKDEIVKENEHIHTFSGAPENANSKVKFIYKTKEIKQDKETLVQTDAKEETDAISLWQKIVNFFTNLF